MTGYRRSYIAGGGFFFERPQDVQQGDGFRKGSTHPTGSTAAQGAGVGDTSGVGSIAGASASMQGSMK
jgi:hypothetical protein